MSSQRPKPVPVQFMCPPKLLKDFDETVKQSGEYKHRTDALLCLMRSLVECEAISHE